MLIWDRVCCRWIAWRGSARAWRALPHAVATVACVLCSGPMRALPVAAGGGARTPEAAAPAQAPTPSWPPAAAFLGSPGGFPGGAGVPIGIFVTGSPGPTPPGIPIAPGGRPVPEPGVLSLLAVGVALAAAVKARKHSR